MVLNFNANNYLGLADHGGLREAAKAAIDRYGYGMASVRFICGTQEEHKALEARIASFLGMEDAILYSSCFDANGGLIETLLGEQDGVISDALNHASIIDGVRLSRAQRFHYANNDMGALEGQLKKADDCRFKLIASDGVFSMDGIVANLRGICDLGEKYGAMVIAWSTTQEALLSYAGRRDVHLGSRCGPHFFVAEYGGGRLHQCVSSCFLALVREIRLRRPGVQTGPRVHDFRHRFAIRTLLDEYRKGINFE
ncbi:hypothetical protein ACVWWI_006595 [Bradyrhizobium sp. USDA 3686]|nr:hypothetical protein [Bradyrhizobium canariense]